ncbi:MAG: hypothetical protein ACXWP4_04525 [Polyangiales bacterium]
MNHVVTHSDSDTPPEGNEGEQGEKKPGSNAKERVLHPRVPAVLEQELKRLAENIRVPVSNLVRTILEDAVTMADRAGRGVEEELQRAATNLSQKREAILAKKEKVAAQRLDGIIGFQPLVLASDATCAKCLTPLAAGDDAHLGLPADPNAPRVVVCETCVPKRPEKKEKSK